MQPTGARFENTNIIQKSITISFFLFKESGIGVPCSPQHKLPFFTKLERNTKNQFTLRCTSICAMITDKMETTFSILVTNQQMNLHYNF